MNGAGGTFAVGQLTMVGDNLQNHGYQASSCSGGGNASASVGNIIGNGINKKSHAGFYFFPQERTEERTALLRVDSYTSSGAIGGSYTALPTEDLSPTMIGSNNFGHAAVLHKSNSYNGIIKPKMTILKQDSLNGRIATSLTDSESGEIGQFETPSTPNPVSFGTGELVTGTSMANESNDEEDAFLVYSNGSSTSLTLSAVSGVNNAANNNNNTSPRRSPRRNKSRVAICYRIHSFITRNWYLSYLVPLSILAALGVVAYLTRDYATHMLYWIETQNKWIVFGLFLLFFTIVSFPIVVGYFVLMITAGYLFGCLRGFLTVILGANLGVMIAHATIRSVRHRIPMHKFIKNETGRAILRVIAGPRAFRVVMFTRLTPIPFGLQNAIFGVSSINPRVYFLATFLGLLPAQTINVYLGSTLRSMQEVLNNHGTAVTGYISFVIEVVCGIGLMFWVVQKARKELSETLLSDISNDGKLIDIQV